MILTVVQFVYQKAVTGILKSCFLVVVNGDRASFVQEICPPRTSKVKALYHF